MEESICPPTVFSLQKALNRVVGHRAQDVTVKREQRCGLPPRDDIWVWVRASLGTRSVYPSPLFFSSSGSGKSQNIPLWGGGQGQGRRAGVKYNEIYI